MCSRYATHDASAKPARIATDRWGKGLEPVTRCIDLAFERPERGSGTIQGLAPVHNRLLRNALIAFTVADLIPAAVLALTFYPPFVQRLTWHGTGRSVPEVRVACVVSLAALALLFVFRKRLEALLDRLDADVRAAAATEPLDAPAATPRGPYVVLVALAIVIAMVAVALARSEEHTSELQSHSDIVCRLLLEKKKEMMC